MDKFLAELAKRLEIPGSDTVSDDEIRSWPAGRLVELMKMGILMEIELAKEVVCNQCEKNCSIEPNIRTNPETGKFIGVIVCDKGRIEIDLDRLRQWKINKRKLWQLVYGCKSEWQLPWDDNNSSYISLQEAVNLANVDSITVRGMSRLLNAPDFFVHRMHKGQRCKVHLGEFKNWLKYAQHGKITDKAIEKYLNGTKRRQEVAKKQKKQP
jgi:hypothetical protein